MGPSLVEQYTHTTKVRRLAVLVAVFSFFCLFSLSAVVLYTIDWMDDREYAEVDTAIHNLLDLEAQSLTRVTQDYAVWDDAVTHLVENRDQVDVQWIDENVGQYLLDAFDIKATSVVWPNHAFSLRVVNGIIADARQYHDRSDDQRRALAVRARTERTANNLKNARCAWGVLSEIAPTHLAVACVIAQETTGIVSPRTDAVLILEREIGDDLLEQFEEIAQADEISVVTGKTPDDIHGSLALPVGAGGTPANLVWTIDLPSDILWDHLIIPCLGIIALTAALMIFFFARTRQVLADIITILREKVQSEHRYRTLIVTVPEMIALIHRGQITYMNPAGLLLAGYNDAQASNIPFKTLFPQGPDPQYMRETAWSLAQLHCQNGMILDVEMTARPIVVNDEMGTLLIARDVTERLRVERSLRAARDEAEQASQAKGQFLANMSHELRTPLNAIVGFSDLMRHEILGPIDNPRYAEYITAIHESGSHLVELIGNILDMAKLEAGRMTLNETVIDMVALIHSVVMLVEGQAQAAQLTITKSAAPDLPYLVADSLKVKQILLNLLSNAIKFTPPKGEVRILLSATAQTGFEVVIEDTGIGMGPEGIRIAMEPFGQVESELARQHHGTGLGLPLAKTLAELHGGTFILTSELGKGTAIHITFPPDRLRFHSSSAE